MGSSYGALKKVSGELRKQFEDSNLTTKELTGLAQNCLESVNEGKFLIEVGSILLILSPNMLNI